MPQERCVLAGPPRTVITYGWDRAALGFFVTVRRVGFPVVAYDALRPGYDGLPGLLRALATAGVVTETDVVEAVRLLPHVLPVEAIQNPGVRLVAQIVTRLRSAAGE